MTYEEKINWLFRYREAERLYQRLSYRLAEAQEATRAEPRPGSRA